MTSQAIKGFALDVLAGVGVFGVTIITASGAQAQMGISNDGIVFPDGLEQTSAVIVPTDCPHGDAIVWDSIFSAWVCAGDLSPIFSIGGTLMTASSAQAQMGISNDGVVFPDSSVQTSAANVPTDCPYGDAIVWDSIFSAWICAGDLTPAYAIGDTGPAGGKVFLVTDGGFHGLESAPADQSANAPWGCSGIGITGADGTAIGTGAQNTADILAGCATAGIAAHLADSYELNGFSDWYVPSKDELNELYVQQVVIGGFVTDYYWSSSQINADDAWAQYFITGNQLGPDKNTPLRVRVVRAF